jgi:hypothetical protein
MKTANELHPIDGSGVVDPPAASITIALPCVTEPWFKQIVVQFTESPLVKMVLIIHRGEGKTSFPKAEWIRTSSLHAGNTLNLICKEIKTKYFLLFRQAAQIHLESHALERFIKVAEITKAGMVYCDYYDLNGNRHLPHFLNDYQFGSVRDDFDFGYLSFFSMRAVRKALGKYGPVPRLKYAGLYDLRLKVSVEHKLFHLQEYLYSVVPQKMEEKGEAHFAYVDPRNHLIQKEMEKVLTRHLKNIGAYLRPRFKKAPSAGDFPVEASVIIPVRNRAKTINDAVHSALSQKTDFPFNIIVVDNHSTDGTTDILKALSAIDAQVKHIIPSRLDLNIGGCWNEAVSSEFCGRYAVQLDSDDLYSGPYTLQKMVDLLNTGKYAMVIGSYTLVNDRLEEIPPGLIDHREWTDANGHNNALRINGLGAPRAFNTLLLRNCKFLNVGYGEDYAMALSISRRYRIGRIYENLYLCRRWEGNTDTGLSIEASNRNNAFKDSIRSMEITARKQLNTSGRGRNKRNET